MESPAPAPAPALAPNAPNPGSCRAVIDVGSNSVKLLVGNVSGSAVHPLVERSEQTRLGEASFVSRRLLPEAIERTALAAARFRAEADRFGAVRIRLIATAAAREAANRDDLVAALRDRTGLEPEVISGEAEAALAFRGVCTAPGLAGIPLLVTDLGGGSTEFIVGRDGIRRFSRSHPLGAVRLLDQVRPDADPPTPADLAHCRQRVDAYLAHQVTPEVVQALASETAGGGDARSIGVGGTAVILARIAGRIGSYDRARIEATRLDAATIRGIVEELWSLPLAVRRQCPGLPPERADIILTGAVIHERILESLRLPALTVSTRGLRFAALLDSDPPP